MKFIHFGCWNKDKCDITLKNNGLSQTMSKLNDFVEKNKDIEFITIAGDNYYPDKKGKEKKEKTMIVANFLSGVNCLPKHILKYVLLGNHEFDKVKVDGNETDKCYLFNFEKNIFSKLNNTIFFNDVIYRIFGNNTLIIMIDTTLYEMYNDYIEEKKKNPDAELNLYDTCYKYLFLDNNELNEKNIGLNFEKLLEKQKEKIENILSIYKKYNNIIFIGHHPIISKKIKIKDGEIKLKIEINESLINLYKSISDLLNNKKIYHLCADTHNYQTGIITIDRLKIEQHITGTGGAEQDDCIQVNGKDEQILENVSYKINRCENQYGFLICNENVDDELEFQFINSNISSDLEGGYYDKYIKYKMKYLKLKNKN